MTLAPLLDALAADPGVTRALAVAQRPALTADITVAAGARPALVAAIARRAGRPLLAVTATTREAEDLVERAALLPGPRPRGRLPRRGRRCPTSD